MQVWERYPPLQDRFSLIPGRVILVAGGRWEKGDQSQMHLLALLTAQLRSRQRPNPFLILGFVWLHTPLVSRCAEGVGENLKRLDKEEPTVRRTDELVVYSSRVA